MKKISKILVTGTAILLAQGAMAEDKNTLLGGTFSASAKFATDYVFRGESEVNDGEIPAVQGSITWSHPSGFYAGYFGSTNKFVTAPEISAVVGPYVGKSGTFGTSDIGYNVMVFDYQYPGASQYNYTELYMYLNKQFGNVNLKLEVTPTLNDWFGWKGHKGIAYAIHPKVNLSDDFTLDGSYGYQHLSGTGAEGWRYWNIGISKPYLGLTFDLRYHGATVDNSHKVYGAHTNLFKDRVVFAVSKSF